MSLGTSMNDTIASWIASAEHTLDIAVYNFNNSALENALNEAAANGIQIRYIYEGQNANFSLGALDDAIVTHPRTDGEGSGMHNKFIVGDADHTETAFVLTGSTNWTTAQLNTDLNNVIVLEDQSIARTYRMEFEEMWGSSGMMPDEANSKFGAQKSDNTPHQFLVGGSPVEVYFSPTDGTNARIRERIYETDYDLEFALLAFTRDDLSEAVQEVGSTIFVNPVGAIEQINTTGSEYETLIAQGMQVYSHQGVPHDLHHKYCIIDQSQAASDPMVITGSHNWSSTAESVNDENTVIVHDARVANLYHQEFRGIINAITGTPDGLDATETKSWTLMPNPAREQVWVRGLQAGDVVSLLDMGGREVSCDQVRASDVVQLNLGVLSAGLYHVAVTSNVGRVTTSLLAVQ
jgi:phosphatidylserine/phosphatidylglycerophosphate/cardiolipin synthase-like enzyme